MKKVIIAGILFALTSCVYRSAQNVPYKVAPFSEIKIECELKERSPCEAVISAFSENRIPIVKKSEYVAKVDAQYGSNSSSAGFFTWGVSKGGYNASQGAEGLVGLGISIYKGEVLISRASQSTAEGTLHPDTAAKSIVRSLLKKGFEPIVKKNQ